MAKASSSKIVRMFHRIFKFRVWSDWDRIESFFHYIQRSLRHLFVMRSRQDANAFADVAAKFNLTDHDIGLREAALRRLCYLMLFAALLITFYFIYQCCYGHFLGRLLSAMVIGIALILAFRYHFWAFQIQQRRLGCSLSMWFGVSFLGRMP